MHRVKAVAQQARSAAVTALLSFVQPDWDQSEQGKPLLRQLQHMAEKRDRNDQTGKEYAV